MNTSEIGLPSPELKLERGLLRGLILKYLARYDDSLAQFELTIEQSRQMNVIPSAIDAIGHSADIDLRRGKLDESGSKLEDAFARLDSYELTSGATAPAIRARLLDVRGTLFWRKDKYEDALTDLHNSLELKQSRASPLEIGATLNKIGCVMISQGKLDDALVRFHQSLEIGIALDNKHYIATRYNNIGDGLARKGEFDQAVEFFEKSLALHKEMDNPPGIARAYNNKGAIQEALGDLEGAVVSYRECIAIREQQDSPMLIAGPMLNLGRVLREKGELSQALGYMQRSVQLLEGQASPLQLTRAQMLIGEIHHSRGQLDEAERAYNSRLDFARSSGNDQLLSYVLCNLVKLSVHKGDKVAAGRYTNELREIDEGSDNKGVHHERLLSEALLMKASDRLADQLQSASFLREIIEDEILDFRITSDALLYLADVLLLELEKEESEAALLELKDTVNRFQEAAQTQRSFRRLAEAQCLKAKTVLLEFDIPTAQDLLTRAQIIADQKGLALLARRISSAFDKLLGQMDEWRALQESGSPMSKRIQLSEVRQSVEILAKGQDEEREEEKPQEPVLLLTIVEESGIAPYSRAFQELDVDVEHLTAGFLTASSSIIAQAFSTEGSLKSIRHDEYTLMNHTVHPISFWYVFKGQSYGAHKKLVAFSEEVQKMQASWIGLTETVPRIPAEDYHKIDQLADDIFLNDISTNDRG